MIGCAAVLLALWPGVALAYQPGDRVPVPPGKAVEVPYGGASGVVGVTAEEGKWFVYTTDLNFGFSGRFYSTYTIEAGTLYGRIFANYTDQVQYIHVDEVPPGKEGVVFQEVDPPKNFGVLQPGVTYRFTHTKTRRWAVAFSDDPEFAKKAFRANGWNPTGIEGGYGFQLYESEDYVDVTPDRPTWVVWNSGFQLTPLQQETPADPVDPEDPAIADPVARAVMRGAQTLLETVVAQTRILVGGSLWLVVLLLSLILLVRVLRGFSGR